MRVQRRNNPPSSILPQLPSTTRGHSRERQPRQRRSDEITAPDPNVETAKTPKKQGAVLEKLEPTSKLEREVLRLEAEGSALIRQGKEVEGVVLLEKALWARSRFASLRRDPWQQGEHHVVTCNQLAVKVMYRLDDNFVYSANQLMSAAERALCNRSNDPFADYHPLRQLLLGATLSNVAALQRLCNETPEQIVATLEKAYQVEHPRPSTRSLFNLGCAYLQAQRFDDCTEIIARCIALASHLLSLPIALPESRADAFRCFCRENAVHAVLAHHLIVAVAQWAMAPTSANQQQDDIARHHAQLALQCAEAYLGPRHALTTRCIEWIQALTTPLQAISDDPPLVPLQMCAFSEAFPPSALLPFVLTGPFPASVTAPLPTNTEARAHLPPIASSKPSERVPVKTQGKTKVREALRNSNNIRVPAPPPLQLVVRPPATAPTANGHGRTHRPSAKSNDANAGPAKPKSQTQRDEAIAHVPRPPVHVRVPGSHEGQIATAGTSCSAPGTPSLNVILPDAGDSVIKKGFEHNAVVTVVPKADYEKYIDLQEEVRRLLHSSETSPHNVRPPPIDATSGSPFRLDGTVVSMPQLIREDCDTCDASVLEAYVSLDASLRGLSKVLPDHTDAEEVIWRYAAFRIQRWLRGCRAKRIVLAKKMAVQEHLRRVQAVERFEAAWIYYTARRAAACRARIVRENLMQGRATVQLQTFARTWLSYQEYCRRVLGHLTSQQQKSALLEAHSVGGHRHTVVLEGLPLTLRPAPPHPRCPAAATCPAVVEGLPHHPPRSVCSKVPQARAAETEREDDHSNPALVSTRDHRTVCSQGV